MVCVLVNLGPGLQSIFIVRYFLKLRTKKHDNLQLKIMLAFSKDKPKEILMPSKKCMK